MHPHKTLYSDWVITFSRIRDDLIDDNVRLISTLLKAKVLARDLKSQELSDWIKYELEGYNKSPTVPEYRIVPTQVKIDWIGPNHVNNLNIRYSAFPEDVQDFLQRFKLRHSISALEEILAQDQACAFSLPDYFTAILQTEYAGNGLITSALQCISRSAIKTITDAVRSKLLDFVLDMLEQYPEANMSENKAKEIPKEVVTNTINNHIYGNSNVVASGSGFTQNPEVTVTANDIGSLKAVLTKMGVSSEDISSLVSEIGEDERPTQHGKFGPRVSQWFSFFVVKIYGGIPTLAANVSAGMIANAIFAYYNLSPYIEKLNK